MKDNANPVVYKVTASNEIEGDFIATGILKRIGAPKTKSTISHGDDQYLEEYDSLYHLDPNQFLSPVERSLKFALASIASNNALGSSENHSNPKARSRALDIFQVAGVNVDYHPRCEKNQGSSSGGGDGTEHINHSMYFFKPLSDTVTPSSPHEKPVQIQSPQARDKITAREVFDMIRNIQDPEHPLTLEQLNVVKCSHVEVIDNHRTLSLMDDETSNGVKKEVMHSFVNVKFTPTIPHCSMATLIGLCIRVKLLRSLPKRFKVTVRINPGTHASEVSINRQLNDKERVIAALENVHLLSVVNKCIANGMNSSVQ